MSNNCEKDSHEVEQQCSRSRSLGSQSHRRSVRTFVSNATSTLICACSFVAAAGWIAMNPMESAHGGWAHTRLRSFSVIFDVPALVSSVVQRW